MKSSKGSQFERDICRLLSLWWSNEERDDLFWRSAGSGAMAKTRKKVGKSTFGQYGDVQATDPLGQPFLDVFTVELKRGYSKDNFANMVDKREGAAMQAWESFLHQVKEDTQNAGSLYWMLIWCRDRRQPIVYLPLGFITKLKKEGLVKKDILKIPHLRGQVCLKNGKTEAVFMCVLNDMLKAVRPEAVKGLLS